MKTGLIAVLVAAWIMGGCDQPSDFNSEAGTAIPHFSTPATRDAIILGELQKQTMLLREIRDRRP